jgi:hypothetical protein
MPATAERFRAHAVGSFKQSAEHPKMINVFRLERPRICHNF